jgi:hypothetical protein
MSFKPNAASFVWPFLHESTTTNTAYSRGRNDQKGVRDETECLVGNHTRTREPSARLGESETLRHANTNYNKAKFRA